MIRFFIFLYLVLVTHLAVSAQPNLASISGKLVSKTTQEALSEIQLFLPQQRMLLSTDSAGQFYIPSLAFGNFTIHILADNVAVDSITIAAQKPQIDLGTIAVNYTSPASQNVLSSESNVPTIALESDPGNLEDEGIASGQQVSVLLNSAGSRDPFLNAVSFVFGQYNFRPRSYNRSSQQVYINGILMNELSTGNAIWSQWSGLNDVFRNQSSSYGLQSNQLAFGGANGAVNFEVSAVDQTPQTKCSYSLSNRSYNNRIMFTRSSGLKKSGWAYTLSASRRWATQGYVPGTSFDGYSAFMSAGKVINAKSQLSLSTVAAFNSRARSGSAIEEVYALAGDKFYNPNWGWQNGAIRNARIANSFQPMVIAHYQYKPSDKTQYAAAASLQTGSNANSSLDWYNAIDPRPDYYRNLPSYYATKNAAAATQLQDELRNDPGKLQIDWDRLHRANKSNQETIRNVNGNAGDTLSGRRSLYVMGADVERVKKISLAGNVQHKQSDAISFYGGAQLIHQQSINFRELTDLMGGDYFVNYNMFAAQQFAGKDSFRQHDVQTPNRAVKEGEKYRYHYTNTINKGLAWAQAEFNFRKLNFFAALQSTYTTYQRNGLYQNGLFVQDSKGKSKTIFFFTYAAKAGMSYKLNGRNYLVLNSLLSAEDPGINNIFIAPKTRNQTTGSVALQQTRSVEAAYYLRAPRLNIRALAYATDVSNSTSIQRFYNDEPEYQSFVNFVMSRVNTRFTGTELAAEFVVNPLLSVSAVASVGQAFYTNRPKVEIYNDNDTNTSPGTKEVFINNYYLGGGPQSAYTVGLAYNSKKFWYLKLNGNYLDRNYVAVNPARRSIEAAELIEKSDPLFGKIFDQEKLSAVFTIDISGGKSWRLNKLYKKIPYSTTLYFNFGISNLLNNRNIKSFGFEQLRYDFTNNNPDKFPTKYIYGYGRSFFANLSLKF